jgi:hypothetical protein
MRIWDELSRMRTSAQFMYCSVCRRSSRG